jgi:hypothetical protein
MAETAELRAIVDQLHGVCGAFAPYPAQPDLQKVSRNSGDLPS